MCISCVCVWCTRVLCGCVRWDQVTGIYSAGEQMLEVKLGHILQDSLSCHHCSCPSPFPPPPSNQCALFWSEHVDFGACSRPPRTACRTLLGGSKGPQARTPAHRDSLDAFWTDIVGAQCKMEGRQVVGLTCGDRPRKRRRTSQATATTTGLGLAACTPPVSLY